MRSYNAGELDYRGPAFGWWVIPDQYTLEALYRHELNKPQRRAAADFLSHGNEPRSVQTNATLLSYLGALGGINGI